MIVERTENPQWLSNAYLVADEECGKGVLIDGNDLLDPLLEKAERDGIEITHILITHPHADHVAGLAEARSGSAEPRSSPIAETAAEIDEEVAELTSTTAASSPTAASRSRRSRPPATPPGTSPSSSTAATSSPPTSSSRAPSAGRWRPARAASTTFRASVMRLMELPPETTVHPGHREPTTIGEEFEGNPFIRVWRGVDELGEEDCTVWGRAATLKLWAPDYDGGNKAWVRFGDTGEEAIVGGSQVERQLNIRSTT